MAQDDGNSINSHPSPTPVDLVNGGLYDALAELFVCGETHRKLSYALLAKKLGAKTMGKLQAAISTPRSTKDRDDSSFGRPDRPAHLSACIKDPRNNGMYLVNC